MNFDKFSLDIADRRGRQGRRLHHAHPHPGTSHPRRPRRSRRAWPGPNRHRQDRRLRAAHPATADQGPAAPGPRPDRRAHPRAGRPDQPDHCQPRQEDQGSQRHRLRRRRQDAPGGRPAPRRRDRRRLPGPPARPASAMATSICPTSRCWCWTRPTACATWASCPTSAASCSTLPTRRQTLLLLGHHARRYPRPGRQDPQRSRHGADRHDRPGGDRLARALPGARQSQEPRCCCAARTDGHRPRADLHPHQAPCRATWRSDLEAASYRVAAPAGQHVAEPAPGGHRRLPRRQVRRAGRHRHRRPRHRRQPRSRTSSTTTCPTPSTPTRTASAAPAARTRTGEAFTFTSPDDEWLVRDIERLLGERIERRRLESFDYGSATTDRSPAQGRTYGNQPSAAGSRAVAMAKAGTTNMAAIAPIPRQADTARPLGMASLPHRGDSTPGVGTTRPKGNPNSVPQGPTAGRHASRNAAVAS